MMPTDLLDEDGSDDVEPLHIAIIGATGRMGRALIELGRAAGHRIQVGITPDPALGSDPGMTFSADVNAIAGADLAIDFSSPAAMADICKACTLHKVALVSGTTGLDANAHDALRKLATVVPVLWEPNMSLGVFVLAWLSERATALLGAEFDIEIVEVHHRRKADAPSGTALRLAASVREARQGLSLVHGREGKPGARDPDELGMHAVRGGDVIGDHSVHFLGDGERLELTHRATSRDLFAKGALRAAEFLAEKPAGRYGLSDVLGLSAR